MVSSTFWRTGSSFASIYPSLAVYALINKGFFSCGLLFLPWFPLPHSYSPISMCSRALGNWPIVFDYCLFRPPNFLSCCFCFRCLATLGPTNFTEQKQESAEYFAGFFAYKFAQVYERCVHWLVANVDPNWQTRDKWGVELAVPIFKRFLIISQIPIRKLLIKIDRQSFNSSVRPKKISLIWSCDKLIRIYMLLVTSSDCEV